MSRTISKPSVASIYVGQLRVLRASDQALMGCVSSRAGGYVTANMFLDMQTPGPGDFQLQDRQTRHATLEDAVEDISQNPDMPDPVHCPFTGHQGSGIFGPILAQWGTMRIVGCVHFANPHVNICTSKELRRSPIVAMVGHGIVIAYIRPLARGWNVVVEGADRTVVRKTCKDLFKALDLFARTLVQTSPHASRHDQMQALASIADFVPRAHGFLDGLHELRTQRADPGAVVHVGPTSVYQTDGSGCLFNLGGLARRDGPVLAHRNGQGAMHTRTTDVVAEQSFDSLDDAVSWVGANPHAPDLAAFTPHGQAYGPELWSMPGCSVVGVAGHTHFDIPGTMKLYVQYAPYYIGYLCANADQHVVTRPLNGRVSTTHHATEAEALIALVQSVAAFLPAGTPTHVTTDAHARIQAFLHDHGRIVQEFSRGCGPHPTA